MMKIRTVYIEKSIKNKSLLNIICSKLSKVKKVFINNPKDVGSNKSVSPFLIKDSLILAEQKGPFILRCPCSPNQIPCGYWIIDWGMGCPYKCSYCYLNYYQNCRGILVYVNINRCFVELEEFLSKQKQIVRIGTGEFIDSLALEGVVPVAKRFVEYFAKKDNAVLELKTKSTCIEHLLKLKHKKRTVISWSVNTKHVAKIEEIGAPSVVARINAAKKAQSAGYPIGFHFDPICYYQGWENDYKDLVDQIFKKITPESVEWISLGTLRFNPALKNILRDHYPNQRLLLGELIVGQDGKMRYVRPLRVKIYNTVADYLLKYIPRSKLYLCMESPEIWQDWGQTSTIDNRYFITD
ncbi:MAG: spore photoproduct lyase family protein [bacterium]